VGGGVQGARNFKGDAGAWATSAAVRLYVEGHFKDGGRLFAVLQQFILQILQSHFFVLHVITFQFFRKLYLALTCVGSNLVNHTSLDICWFRLLTNRTSQQI
jgi:hypothetical protein